MKRSLPAHLVIRRAMLRYERVVIAELRRNPSEQFEWWGHRIRTAIDRLEKKGALQWVMATRRTPGHYILNARVADAVMKARA